MIKFFENIKSLFGKKETIPPAIAAPVESVVDEPEDESVWPWSFGLNENGQAEIIRKDKHPARPPSRGLEP